MNEVQDRARLYSALLHGNPMNNPSSSNGSQQQPQPSSLTPTPTSSAGNIFQFNGHYSPSSSNSIGTNLGMTNPLPSPLASPGYAHPMYPSAHHHHAYLQAAAYHHALSTPSSPFLMSHPNSPSVGPHRPTAFFPTPSLEQYHAAQQQALILAREREAQQRDQQLKEEEEKHSSSSSTSRQSNEITNNREDNRHHHKGQSHSRRHPIPPPLPSLGLKGSCSSNSPPSSATGTPSPRNFNNHGLNSNAGSTDRNNNDSSHENKNSFSANHGSHSPTHRSNLGSNNQMYSKGTLIQLADGRSVPVEEMKTQDFLSCVESTPDVAVDVSKVVKIDCSSSQPDQMLITLSVGKRKTHFTVSTPVEHPFFVYNRGWSSCSPDKTKETFGLHARKLTVGDYCVSLLKAK